MRYVYATILLVTMGLSGWVGWKLHPDQPASSIDVSKSIATKDTVITRKPDGTIVEHIKETTTVDNRRVIVPKYNPPKWSAGVDVRAPYNKLSNYHYTGVLYHRVGDTNLWAGLGASSKKEILVGVRIDF